MITKAFAILLAVLGLLLSSTEVSARPPMGGGWRGGGWRGGIAAPRFGGFGRGPRAFGPRAYGPGPYGGAPYGYGAPRPYGPPGGYGAPAGYGGYPGRFGGGWPAQQNAVRQAVREGRQVPLSQAIEAVRRRTPGHELDAGMETGPNGRPAYRVRWAGEDGRRQDYLVDAGTGAVIGPQGAGGAGAGAPGGQPSPWGGP